MNLSVPRFNQEVFNEGVRFLRNIDFVAERFDVANLNSRGQRNLVEQSLV